MKQKAKCLRNLHCVFTRYLTSFFHINWYVQVVQAVHVLGKKTSVLLSCSRRALVVTLLKKDLIAGIFIKISNNL